MPHEPRPGRRRPTAERRAPPLTFTPWLPTRWRRTATRPPGHHPRRHSGDSPRARSTHTRLRTRRAGSPRRMNITFLGTGIMGAPMARHLADAEHDVTVWNRSAEKARPLAQHGVSVAEDPAAAMAGAEVVVTMLTDGAAVEDVMREAAPAAP